jgi:hypothetical protein
MKGTFAPDKIGLKVLYGWIGLVVSKGLQFVKYFYFLFFFILIVSPSGIATCIALHAICRFRKQYCSQSSNSD